MAENQKFKDYITKKNFLKFIKKICLTILILSPIIVFILGMYFFQLSFPDEKDPFVQWSGHDPRTEAIITWETEKKEKSTVWYGLEKNDLKYNETDDERVKIHIVKLEGLQPETKYFYRVGVDGDDPIYRSDVFSFETAPNDTDTDFSFIAYSDSQQFFGIGWHKRICDAIAGHDDLSFVVDVGDLCQNWDYKPDWNQFFTEAHVYMQEVPFVPCMGNHDGYYPDEDPKAEKHWYEQYFGATNSSCDPHSFYYSFNWSNTLFVIGEISKGEDEDPTLERNIRHDRWLNKTLARGQDKAFRILMFHRQLFSAEDNNNGLLDRIIPIVEKYNVSLVFYGHHHHYERFLYNDHTYICLGGGGGQQFGSNYFRLTDYTETFAMGPSYTKVSISSDKIDITTYTPEDDVLDSCTLKLKGSDAILKD
ncbi:MAG: fibronectin type III domain-containing protein [Promethearchaeota archaeon]